MFTDTEDTGASWEVDQSVTTSAMLRQHTLSYWDRNEDIDKIADRNLEKGGVGFIQTLPEECELHQVGSVLQQCARQQPAVGQARDSGQ